MAFAAPTPSYTAVPDASFVGDRRRCSSARRGRHTARRAPASAAYGINGLNQSVSVGGATLSWSAQGNLIGDGTLGA